MRFLLVLILLSFNANANTIGTFDKYKGNFDLLNQDIKRMESVQQKNSNALAAEMLKDMIVFKSHFDYIASPLSLADLNQDAKDNGWSNLQRMSGELQSVCEGAGQSLAGCKAGLEQIRLLAFNSKLSAENKDSIYSFIDDYILQIKAFEIVNPTFIARFNKNAEVINTKIQAATKKVVETESAVAPVERIPATELIAEDIVLTKTHYFFFILAISFIMIAAHFYRNFRNQKTVTTFYSKLFTLAKKSNIQLRVFGSLTTAHVALVKKIQLPFLNSVYLSRAVSNNAQVKFKNKKNNVSIEVSFITSRSLQNVMDMPKEKAFKESVEALQAAVESDGGEFVYSNRFNSLGELVQSSLVLHMPK